MTLKLIVRGEGIDEERIDRFTRELLKEIRAGVDPTAQLRKEEATATNSKGAATLLGQIAMSLISGGVISKLVEQLTSYLNRNRKLVFELEKSDGTKLKLSYDYISGKNSDQVTDSIAAFIRK